jgi:hypothetical protein
MVLLTTPPRGDGPAWPFFLFSLILMVVVLLPTYVLNALPLYSIASRRKLKAAWLAWVPIGSAYILGLISDDYQLLALGNDKNRRIWLPVLHGLTVVLIVVFMVWAFFSFGNEDSRGVAWLPFFLAAMVVCVVVAVMKWMATYDLFRSCEPDRAGVYLAICLGIRFVMPSFSIVREILMLVVSGKDLGMPRLDLLENREPAERPIREVKEPWDI